MARVDKIVSEQAKALFPVKSIGSLEKLFKLLLGISSDTSAATTEPNLALISILLGMLEHSLTNTASVLANVNTKVHLEAGENSQAGTHAKPPSSNKKSLLMKRKVTKKPSQSVKSFLEEKTEIIESRQDFPTIELDILLSLYEQFHANVFSSVNMNLFSSKSESNSEAKEIGTGTSKELIRHVSDVIWNSLSKTYAFEKPHLQTLYSYLTGNKLDSFGMAFSVVAACQLLQIDDAHLVLSEDHAWVCFGKDGEQDCEVTWHGKNTEDIRGKPVTSENHSSWLYLKGNAVKCTSRQMEVAAIVTGINPTINSNADSLEMSLIQKNLLWIVYDAGVLQKYPNALGTLAELEELHVTEGRKRPPLLFEESIRIAMQFYNNMHVYPYTFYGNFLFRQQNFKKALEYWTKGAHVLSQYHYDIKDDEEIYKEYLDVTKDYLPSLMKQCTEGISSDSLTRDPFNFAQLLRLFDGICLWEETGSVPIVHIVWARSWINAINKFDSSVRKRVIFITNDASKKGSEKIANKLGAGTASAAGSSSTSTNIELDEGFLSHATNTTSVITSTTLSATELICDISVGSILSSIESASSNTAFITASVSSSAPSDIPSSQPFLAQLAKASAEILIDPNSFPLISSLPCTSSSEGSCETNNNIQERSANNPINWTTNKNGDPCVTVELFSGKLKCIADLLQFEKFKTSTLTVMLTAQTFTLKEPIEMTEGTNTGTLVRTRGRRAVAGSDSARETSANMVSKRKSTGNDQVSTNLNPNETSLPPKKRSRKL